MAEGISDFTAIVERAGVHQPALDAQNGEELMHVQPGVSIALGNRPPESPGSLLTSTKQVVWLSDADRAKGYSMGFYVYITACCFQGPRGLHLSLYIRSDENESEGSDSECIGVLDLSKITEMRFVPSDPNPCTLSISLLLSFDD